MVQFAVADGVDVISANTYVLFFATLRFRSLVINCVALRFAAWLILFWESMSALLIVQ